MITQGGWGMLFKGSFISGKPVVKGSGAGPAGWIVFMLCPLVFSFCVSCTYLGMRGVMRLGGFVASGGPYEIAHPAPDWIWIFPLSIFLMIASIFLSFFASSRVSGPNIMALSWSAIFISLGWNFLQFGFGIGMGGRLAAGWIICAAFFIPMGLTPLIFILRSFFRSVRERDDRARAASDGQLAWRTSLSLQLILAGAGAWLGVLFFNIL